MRVSQRLDYALRAVVEIARSRDGSPVPAGAIAERLGLPRRFVEQQVSALARRDIVACQRGAKGGCGLARRASEITIGDVVRAIEGEVLDVPVSDGSAVGDAWVSLAGRWYEVLEEVTLDELAHAQDELERRSSATYYI
ncbi:MAG: Rrf2 family transcriptional regulator [Actinomycetota bacterium]|nr:Rrf2 family transcriptional regulator [Actinomycetota bacterium]